MCKMAHFENCDPETRDQEYCIFHKPNKSKKEAAEFWDKFLLQFYGYRVPWKSGYTFGIQIDAQGFIFPEMFAGDDELTGIEGRLSLRYGFFGKELESIFDDAIFEEDVNFSESIFEGRISFDVAQFKKEAVFSLVTFKEDVYFIGTQFNGRTDFIGATFEGEFNNFDTSMFKHYVQFEETIFVNDVHFDNSTFNDEVGFVATIFCGDIYFIKTVFKDVAIFEYAYFNGDVIFSETIFEKTARFSGSLTDYPEYLEYLLEGVEGLDEIKDIKRLFERLSEFNCKILSKYKFIGRLIFSNVTFKAINFIEPLKWIKSNKNVINYFNSLFKHPSSLAEAARVQRLSFEKEGKHDEADKMFVLEMRAKRKIRKSKLSESAVQKAISIWGVRHLLQLQDKLTSWLFNSSSTWKELLKLLTVIGPMVFIGLIAALSVMVFQFLYVLGYIGEVVLGDWISLYGTSWERVLGASFLVISGSAGGFWIGQKLGLGTVCLKSNVTQAGVVCQYHIHTFKDALYYSLVTFTTLGYGDMHPTGWLKALSATEALTGAVFMALIVAVIARKWMR